MNIARRYFRLPCRSVAYKYNVGKFFCTTAATHHDTVNGRLKICTIPALQDNYMYVIVDRISKVAAAIDPVEPEKILNYVKGENAKLKAILTTHHHYDHAGGNKVMTEIVKDIVVYGGDDRIDCLTNKLSHKQEFRLNDLLIQCLYTPCHTRGHVCYFIQEQIAENDPICFTGDTLFVGGCGRFFEGSAEQMLKSLNILLSLPQKTKIYCGHEYTLSNLKFALNVEPNNCHAQKKLKECEEKLLRGEPTVPSTVKEEKLYNPFLRVHEKLVQLYTNQTDPVSVMKVLREHKDNFKS